MLVLAISQRKTRRSSVGLRNKQTKKDCASEFLFFFCLVYVFNADFLKIDPFNNSLSLSLSGKSHLLFL